jgi:two-component system sensor histidine kinase LytS
MAAANAMGIAVFMIIIHNAIRYQTKIAALQTHKALRIANATLPYLRQGLTNASAKNVAATIMDMTTASAVALTDCEKVLAHIGKGSDHHVAEGPIVTNTTKTCLATGHIEVAQTAKEIDCSYKECPLKSAVVVPLFCQNEIVGTLKLYYSREEAMTTLDMEFAQGLGQIFSTQLELAKLQKKAELAAEAELKALRAQINPHFLFNALNTIVSLCRTNPEEARNLIIELSEFFRLSLKTARDFVTIKEELEHVDSYLTLEKARFGRRLNIVKNIDESILNSFIPAFTLQPLVENAVKHGLLSQNGGGTVSISAYINDSHIAISIEDNGQGIPEDKLKQITLSGFGKGAGVGLTNVNERLKAIYGVEYALDISSVWGQGTIVKLRIPINNGGVVA